MNLKSAGTCCLQANKWTHLSQHHDSKLNMTSLKFITKWKTFASFTPSGCSRNTNLGVTGKVVPVLQILMAVQWFGLISRSFVANQPRKVKNRESQMSALLKYKFLKRCHVVKDLLLRPGWSGPLMHWSARKNPPNSYRLWNNNTAIPPKMAETVVSLRLHGRLLR
jgi:hypothetical protein